MVYSIDYERPRSLSNSLIKTGFINQYTFIVPLFDLELHGYFRKTQQQYLEKSQKTFDYLPGPAKESKQGIRYYGVKYTVLLPSTDPTPKIFIDMVGRYVKDRFYTLKDLTQQVYLIDPINKTDDFYRQRYREIRTRKILDDEKEKKQRQEMQERDTEEKVERGFLKRRRWGDKGTYDPNEVRKPSKRPSQRPPLKPMQKLKL